MAVPVEAFDTEAAVDEVVRSALRAIAAAADDDQLPPEATGAVSSVLIHMVAEIATPVPSALRIPLLARSHELINQFAGACARESV